MSKKSIIGLAAAIMALGAVSTSSASAAGVTGATVDTLTPAMSDGIVKTGRRGFKRKWRHRRHFYKFRHGYGCGYFYYKWKRTGRPFWKYKFFDCRDDTH
ncbi:MAG: hypothetical protein ACR2PG_00420 [Hyphomicrobiaceae bacterium]